MNEPAIPYGYRRITGQSQRGDGIWDGTRFAKVKKEYPHSEGRPGFNFIIRKCAVVQPELPGVPEPVTQIRIDKCTDPRAWYAHLVGQTIPVERAELNLHPSQGIPCDVYWCREGGVYNPINYVRTDDATVVWPEQGMCLDE